MDHIMVDVEHSVFFLYDKKPTGCSYLLLRYIFSSATSLRPNAATGNSEQAAHIFFHSHQFANLAQSDAHICFLSAQVPLCVIQSYTVDAQSMFSNAAEEPLKRPVLTAVCGLVRAGNSGGSITETETPWWSCRGGTSAQITASCTTVRNTQR